MQVMKTMPDYAASARSLGLTAVGAAAAAWGAFSITASYIARKASSGWCGDPMLAPGVIVFAGHCLPCWTNGATAAVVVLALRGMWNDFEGAGQ